MSRNYRDPEWWIGNALPRGRAKALEAVDRAYVGIQRRRGVDAPVADWDNPVTEFMLAGLDHESATVSNAKLIVVC